MNYLRVLFDLYNAKNNAKKSAAQIKKLQQRELRKMLKYAYDHSEYYRQAFQAAGITAENINIAPLEDFPTIDKQTLLSHFDEIITVSDITQDELRRFDESAEKDRRAFKEKYHVVHSSGSTGKPGYFVYDNNAWNAMLIGIIRAALWGMSMPQILKLLAEKPRIAYIAATDGRYGGAMAVGDGIGGVGASQIYLDVKTPLSEWIERIREFNPNMIIGYPSAVKILGELAENGDVELNITRVVTCGEPLGANLRRYLESVFATEVINFYGASESLVLGVESDPEHGMILFDDMNVIEVQDGNMYLTSLYNFAQPLIRYRLTDSLTLQKADDNCPFTRAVGLLGRSEDILWFEDSMGNREFLHPLAVEGFCIEGLMDYQFVQLGNNVFEMRAQVSAEYSCNNIRNEIIERMKMVLNEKHLDFVQFYVKFVDEILPEQTTGKKRLIIGTSQYEQTRRAAV
ncbi:MAG: AMP-binding protein [Oscillospiraceae bacterium]|nr:AMP-binding protein [Oscillospiraceae bacterium]